MKCGCSIYFLLLSPVAVKEISQFFFTWNHIRKSDEFIRIILRFCSFNRTRYGLQCILCRDCFYAARSYKTDRLEKRYVLKIHCCMNICHQNNLKLFKWKACDMLLPLCSQFDVYVSLFRHCVLFSLNTIWGETQRSFCKITCAQRRLRSAYAFSEELLNGCWL